MLQSLHTKAYSSITDYQAFGMASAPAIFQHTMENILQGIPDVLVYLDNIMVAGSSEAEHMQLLERVLAMLEYAGIRSFCCPPFSI